LVERPPTNKQTCAKCGKRIASESRDGSLTSYLFRTFDCNCNRSSAVHSAKADNENDFCPTCGLVVAPESKGGSLTGFLFQSTRCKCPRNEAFSAGKMSAKFWKLKGGSDTIFVPAGAVEKKAAVPLVGLKQGALIGGVYNIIELIGRGGMGEVYLARHVALNKKCALKVIPPEQVTEMGWQRFQLEAKAVAKLDHVNLVRVTDLGIHDGCLPFFAMDYVSGKNLAELVAERGPMPLKAMLDIFKQVCDGLDFAHRNGILHRDLKPANIMMVIEPGGARTAKVLDFGLAKLTGQGQGQDQGHDRDKQSLTAVGDIFGSPFYMSPEQCQGEKLDNRSDIYSLGCAMFECLTGRPPFVGNITAAVLFSQQEADPPSLEGIVGAGKFPASLEIVMAKMLRKNPVERYQTCRELKTDLERIERGENVLPVYASRGTNSGSARADDQQRKNIERDAVSTQQKVPLAFFVAGGLVTVLAATALVVFLLPSHKPPPGKQLGNEIVNPTQNFGAPGHRSFHGMYLTDSYESGTGTVLLYKFPKVPIGSLIVNGVTTIPCQGDVEIDVGSNVAFRPDIPIYFSADRQKEFRANDLNELILEYSPRLFSSESAWNELNTVSQLTGLNGVTIASADADASSHFDRVLPLLEKLPQLNTLKTTGKSSLSMEALAKSTILGRLKFLSIDQAQQVTPMLEILTKSTNIEHLRLRYLPLHKVDYQLISGMKNLKSLEINDANTDNEDLQWIAKLSHLENLSLTKCEANTDFMSFLKQLRWGTLKTIDLTAQGMTRTKQVKLYKSWPGLCFPGSKKPKGLPDPETRRQLETSLKIAANSLVNLNGLMLRVIPDTTYDAAAKEDPTVAHFVEQAIAGKYGSFVLLGAPYERRENMAAVFFKDGTFNFWASGTDARPTAVMPAMSKLSSANDKSFKHLQFYTKAGEVRDIYQAHLSEAVVLAESAILNEDKSSEELIEGVKLEKH